MMIVPRRKNDLFDEFFDNPFFERGPKRDMLMKSDVRETKDSFIIDIDLPGYDKENIKIDVTDGYLNINASVNTESNENEPNYIRKERFIGECSRSFYIGEEVEKEDIKATFKNGTLSLTVPKVNEELKQPEKKYIEISD